ncbi:MAG: methyltransferase domain-containing protein [Candidatus Omnitrophica bacterium]|nr:methyltransferase domain-containing protein [Candidatus Omnitrophota bacterium]
MLAQETQRVREAFSRAACQYDTLAGLQEKIGERLVTMLPQNDCDAILDIGMGTGRLTHTLSQKYAGADIFCFDFSYGMAHYAKQKYPRLNVLQADACALPFREGVFDLIVSNSAYQWIEDLTGAFNQARVSLKDNGMFCAAVFTQETLNELFCALQQASVLSTQEVLNRRRLPSAAQVEDALKASGLTNIKIERAVEKIVFGNMWDLLRWLKGLGANRMPTQFYTGKNRLFRANEYYQQHFKEGEGVFASFEVLWLQAKKQE